MTDTVADAIQPGQRAVVRAFPCASCNAKLTFKPGTRTLKCEFCGAQNDIPNDPSVVEELDLETWLRQVADEHARHEAVHVKCGSCGAEQDLARDTFAGRCRFCATPIVSEGYAQRLVKPRSLIPFQVAQPQAQAAFRQWINGLWLAPSALKQYARGDGGIQGVYVPYWTFDCSTETDYTGERGTDHTRSYTDSNGQHRTETETTWTRVSGHVSNLFDDVLVSGSPTLQRLSFFGADRFFTWDTKALVPYAEEFVAGFSAEAYQVNLEQGFAAGKEIIDGRIVASIKRDIGGDHQRVGSVHTEYSDLTFKHVLVPVWISAYRYRDKVYRFMINGQNGAVQGESPKSWVKITLLVLGGIVLLYLLAQLGGKN